MSANGKQIQLEGNQLAALILFQRRIAELNNDKLVHQQMGAAALMQACEQATALLSKASDEYVAETQRAVKLVAEMPKMVTQ